MVAPVCIQNPEFRLVRIPAFGPEVAYHFPQVIGVHRQPHFPAICLQIRILHGRETFQHLHRNDRSLLRVAQPGKILFP